MSLLREVPRGIEYEYAVVSESAADAPTSGRAVIHRALQALHRLGYTASVRWSVREEVGNLGYETSLAAAWTLSDGPFPIAYNGMRLYEDAMHLEVATPLYATPLDAIRYSQVGEYLVHAAISELRGSPGLTKVNAYKNNVSNRPTEVGYEAVAYGTHSNVALRRRDGDSDRWGHIASALGAYFVARVPLIGSGDFVPVLSAGSSIRLVCVEGVLVGSEPHYAVSPRACFITRLTSSDTMADRGLVNLRDEPLADARYWWRYHDIHQESVRCPFQIYVRDVLTAFVFAAYQRGMFEDAPRLRDPVRAIKAVSLDTRDFKWHVQLHDGTVVDVVRDVLQGYYLARLRKLVEAEGDSEDKVAYEVLEWTVDRLAKREFSDLMWRLDWITKRGLLGAYGARGGKGLLVCNQYSLIDETVNFHVGQPADLANGDSLFEPDTALAPVIDRLRLDPDAWSASVRKALHDPPEGTREASRALILRRFETEVLQANWERFHFVGGSSFALSDPTGPSESLRATIQAASTPDELR